ncbi:probable phosphoglycerate mutase family protein [Ramularia collo-cygni]|uniref:Probable phosphoglycerate mutase family protein n=1 Tax=Ramularia collo-cygni TaxID=112498 RepID=A0A2D3UYX7_9PEZI|nr:probable phosphoglycerate mutase family protein [Ramularia collo-cygni]CZT18410.1 probable phosphoglycerate mutase family protein [Ramularia collo-cygni]
MKSALAILSLLPLALGEATVYLIRHGEKPSSGNGLNAQGMQRAQCLRNVFGANSGYNIDTILTQQYKSDGSRKRPYDTVTPLAQDLGLTINHSCDRDDPDCVKDAVKAHRGSGNILICWEHDALHDIVKDLGASDAPSYPSDRFDLIWKDPYNYSKVTDKYSENCPGLDN